MKNGNKTAFPEHPPTPNGLGGEEYSLVYGSSGLTKREYFAAMAIQGMLAAGMVDPPYLSGLSIRYADALLAELEKPQP